MTDAAKPLPLTGMLKTVFDSRYVGFLVVDDSGKVRRANPFVVELLGSPIEETTCRFNLLTLPTIPADKREQLRRTLKQGRRRSFDIDYVSMHGKASALTMEVHPIKEGDLRGFAVCIVLDDTSKQRLAQHLQQAAQTEGLALLSGVLAHDLNNLLTTGLGYAGLARSIGDPRKREQALERVESALESAAGLVDHLLEHTSRKRANRSRSTPFGLALERMINVFEHRVISTVTLHKPKPPKGVSVAGSPSQIEPVLLNLLLNAQEAMGAQGGEITLSWELVDAPPENVAWWVDPHEGRYIRFSVEDSGVGIPHENLRLVFEPLFTTKGASGGTGLGLYSVRKTLEELSGTVSITSLVGRGTQIDVFFPLAVEADNSAALQVPVVRTLAGRGERVLLMEPDDMVREMLVWLLLKNGYKVLTAVDCAEASQILEGGETPVDLLLASVTSDVDFREHCIAGSFKVSVPALFLLGADSETASLPPGSRSLHKPFKPEGLLVTLGEILSSTYPDSSKR